jgi:hypothetical protein
VTLATGSQPTDLGALIVLLLISEATVTSLLQVVQKSNSTDRATLFATLPASISRRSIAKLIVNQDFGEKARNAQITIGRCRAIGHHALSEHERIYSGIRMGE